MLLASDVPDAWKRHQLKSVGRQLRHWTKKVRQSFGAPVSGVGGTGPPETLTGEDDFDAGPVQAWLTQLVKTAQGIERSASTGGPSTPGRKPPVPPKPKITPSAKKKLRFTLEVSTAELAKELPFSEELSDKPWEGSALTSAVKRNLRKKEATVAKKKGKTIAKKSLGLESGKHRDGTDSAIATTTRPIHPTATTFRTRGKLFDVQKLLAKTGMEFLWPGYQYMGPGTHLEKQLARGDPGINRLDRLPKASDIDYGRAKDLKEKWVADRKMIAKIDKLAGRKTLTERTVKNIMKAKLKLGM